MTTCGASVPGERYAKRIILTGLPANFKQYKGQWLNVKRGDRQMSKNSHMNQEGELRKRNHPLTEEKGPHFLLKLTRFTNLKDALPGMIRNKGDST
jgi:hypothetical protein